MTVSTLRRATVAPSPTSHRPPRPATTAAGSNPQSTRWVSASYAATVLQVSKMTIYRMINAGDLDAVRVGRSFRVRAHDVARHLHSRHDRSAAAPAG